jgi:hypothetical protein
MKNTITLKNTFLDLKHNEEKITITSYYNQIELVRDFWYVKHINLSYSILSYTNLTYPTCPNLPYTNLFYPSQT